MKGLFLRLVEDVRGVEVDEVRGSTSIVSMYSLTGALSRHARDTSAGGGGLTPGGSL